MPVIELRGILRRGEFRLLRVHEHVDTTRLRTRYQYERPGLVARLTDEAGAVLSHGTAGVLGSAHGRPAHPVEPAGLIRVIVPLTERGRVVELVEDGTVRWRGAIGERAPEVRATADAGDGGLAIAWQVEPRVPVDIYATTVDGTRRRLLRKAATEPFTADALPGGPFAVQVRAVHELRETLATTEPLRLSEERFTVQVDLERDRVPEGQPVTGFASVFDEWGRAVDDHVTWLVDGEPAGTGPVVVIAAPPGRHDVVARADRAASDPVELTVDPV